MFTQNSTTTTNNYLFDGDNVIEELDSGGNGFARYWHGGGIDEPLAETRSGMTGYYHQDALASVTSLSSTAGTLANTYIYDAFGTLTSSTGGLTNPFQYTGRDYDPETGLRYYRARYYEPTTGRFLSEDPVGFKGGLDFYSYVLNEPTKLVDPSGLKCTQISPWMAIPAFSDGKLKPIFSVNAGDDWHVKDWGIVSIPGWVDGSAKAAALGCWCDWWADHHKVFNTYARKELEGAWFECDPCKKRENHTRTVTNIFSNYGEGDLFIPTAHRREWGFIIQTDEFARTPSKRTSTCTACLVPPR